MYAGFPRVPQKEQQDAPPAVRREVSLLPLFPLRAALADRLVIAGHYQAKNRERISKIVPPLRSPPSYRRRVHRRKRPPASLIHW